MDREDELHEQIAAIYLRKREEADDEAKALIEELSAIIAAKPAPRVVIIEGGIAELIGALANGQFDGDGGPCGDPDCPFCGKPEGNTLQ
jgi:hypothetical protein